MVGWHHRLDGHEFEQAPGVSDGQGSLACCSPWVCKESDTSELLNRTENSAITMAIIYNLDQRKIFFREECFIIIITLSYCLHPEWTAPIAYIYPDSRLSHCHLFPEITEVSDSNLPIANESTILMTM